MPDPELVSQTAPEMLGFEEANPGMEEALTVKP
jgi:hypothetical protein